MVMVNMVILLSSPFKWMNDKINKRGDPNISW